MQGIQSSIVPEKTEKRGLMSAPNGPLEAAKRYLERQRESEAALTAMDAEGADASLDGGRPAWLRRWQGEAPHPAPGMTPEMTSGTTAAMNAASGSVEEAVQSLADGTGHGDQAPAVNGYTGQSIEASFDFETVFHFETELEAEGTEDWLDLLGERSQPEASGHTPDLLHPERDLERSELKAWEIPFETTHREEPRRSTEAFAAVEPLPDPQAVRAAIFRLAHEASNRWRTPQDLPETPGTSGKLGIDGALEGVPLDLSRDAGTDVAPAAESATGNSDIGFAEVARQVWCRPEGINPAERILISRANPEGTFSSTEDSHPVHESAELRDTEHSNGHSSIQAVSESVAGVVKVDLTGSVSGIWGGANGLAEPETARETSVAAAQNASPTEYTRQEQQGDNGLPRSCATPSTPSRMEHPEGKLEQEGTLNGALGGIRSEVQDEVQDEIRDGIRDEMRRETRSQSTEVDDARVASLPESLPDTSTPNLRGMQDTASDAPALAHDASNLLSALKLYSELLALSGVLQARHSHYAQDLKLLAARSEVLIDRLLASCSLAERDARQLIQDHVLDGAGPASLDSANAPARERGTGETAGAMPNGSSLPSRAAEWDSSQCHSVAPEEDLLTEDLGVVAAPSLVSSFSRKLEEPSSGRVEALQESAIESGVARIESPIENSIDIPEKERFVVEVTQFPGKDSAARLAEAALSPTGARDVGANSGPGVDPINLVDLLTRWGSLLSMIARGPVEVKFGPQAALPIQVGEEAMERILVNLVHNAMTATRNGGAIRIGVGRAETRRPALSPLSSEGWVRPASKMVLTVDDSGCGMSEQQIAKALGMGHAKIGSVGLDPGLDTGSDRDRAIEAGLHLGGSHRRHGMGLKIVRELVAASGGELAIYSRCGVGTRIEIRWPILQETVEQGDRRQVQSAKVSGEASGGFTHNRLRQGLEGAIAC